MSELPRSAPGADPSVRARCIGASDSLTSDHVANLSRASGKIFRCGLNRLTLHAVCAARTPGLGDYSELSLDRGLSTTGRVAGLLCGHGDACAQSNELHTRVGRR